METNPSHPAYWARLLILAGDIEVNPGPPPRYPCGLCHKEVTWRVWSVPCNNCGLYFHRTCLRWTVPQLRATWTNTWVCPPCTPPVHPHPQTEEKTAPVGQLQRSVAATEQLSEKARVSAMMIEFFTYGIRIAHSKQLISKFSCINNVLATLAWEGNFAKYQEYLKTPQLAIDSFLRALVRERVRVCDRGGSARHRHNVEKALGLAKVRSAAESLDNFRPVGEGLVRGKVRMKIDLSDKLGVVQAVEEMEAMERAVAARLRAEVLRGCEARCPFCLEPCGCADVGHEEGESPTRHATDPGRGHKPVGCLGYRDAHTGALSTATCGEWVKRFGGLTFANADTGTKEVRYADYASIYPDWDITADHDTHSGEGSYWKWFMCRYNEDLAKLYASKPANIPEAWKSLTREGEIRKLLTEE